MKRKEFITLSAALAGIGPSLLSCSSRKQIPAEIVGSSSTIGHLIRDTDFKQAPSVVTNSTVVIIGAGISGLSAARHLQQQGITDFVLLDLEDHAGGNSSFGKDAVSAYPWGAHYIPIPNNDLPEYHAFLQEAGVITHVDGNGLPTYNESYLCFDPQERLYINGRWQDGLIPNFGVPGNEIKQIDAFLQKINELRYLKGSDGKEAFAIPADNSSKDAEFITLDKITMKDWLNNNGFTSQYLHDYVNYCCRDDYGTAHDVASAWAGIHYFASRKGKGSNAVHADVLTWPEGNGFLVKQLQEKTGSQLQLNSLAVKVNSTATGVRVEYIDTASKALKAIDAKQCIMAVPQFIAARLLNDSDRQQLIKQHFHYTPWVVANLSVSKLEERTGAPLSWDNVIHGGQSLGYVNATQQLLQQHQDRHNITWYLPLTGNDPATERKQAQQKTADEWAEIIMNDLVKVHPNIRSATTSIKVMLWGHAMAQPKPGMIFDTVRSQVGASINNTIHFAHSDIAGISIFEEAFYQGLNAAKKILSLIR